jgi:hypothetical protein
MHPNGLSAVDLLVAPMAVRGRRPSIREGSFVALEGGGYEWCEVGFLPRKGRTATLEAELEIRRRAIEGDKRDSLRQAPTTPLLRSRARGARRGGPRTRRARVTRRAQARSPGRLEDPDEPDEHLARAAEGLLVHAALRPTERGPQ